MLLYALGEKYAKANYAKAGKDDTESLKKFFDEHIDKAGFFESAMVFYRDGSEAAKKTKK